MKNIQIAIICGVIALIAIGWSIGVVSDIFATSTFSAFWWIPRETAFYATFTVLDIGGGALMLGMSYWLQRKDEKTKIPKTNQTKE
jgi:hypothetical protein